MWEADMKGDKSSANESDYEPEPEEEHLSEGWVTLEDEQDDGDLIPKPDLWDLGFGAMLKFSLPLKKSIKCVRSQET